jgi:hypothetical protein
VQELPPDADYRFKHALIQDAAYENLLKSRRQALHSRVGETLREKFAGTPAAEPELLTHHFTRAGMTEAAIEWWGKAGWRSVERSALVEAVAQLTRALDQIATLPGTPALRREQIRLQAALITPLIHIKGYSAPETKAAVDRAQADSDSLYVADEPENVSYRRLIVELAEKGRLPTIYPWRQCVEAGGLMSYGIDLSDVGHRIAHLVDQILKGAKPGEIPIFQPTQFELSINLKTAKTLGIELPPLLVARADNVIE